MDGCDYISNTLITYSSLPSRSDPGNGERLFEVLAPQKVEAPGSRALEDYLLGCHGMGTVGGNPKGQVGQDAEGCTGLPGSCWGKSTRRGPREPGACGSWAGGAHIFFSLGQRDLPNYPFA